MNILTVVELLSTWGIKDSQNTWLKKKQKRMHANTKNPKTHGKNPDSMQWVHYNLEVFKLLNAEKPLLCLLS